LPPTATFASFSSDSGRSEAGGRLKALEVVMEAAITEAIDAIRPALQMDGGDIDFVGVEDGVVKVKLSGACDSCSISWLTLKAGVERILKDRVPGVTAVEAI
jgi:Fe-S cluster biogenesis protein NfuA